MFLLVYGCPDVMARHKITLSDLVFWNPWLSGASESACSDSMYSNMIAYRGIMCVGVNGTVIGRTDGPTTTSFSSMLPSSTQASSTSSAAPPAPTREGMISTCTELYTVTEGGSCAGVQSTFGISFNDFYAWNPSSESSCALRSSANVLTLNSRVELRELVARLCVLCRSSIPISSRCPPDLYKVPYCCLG